MSLETLWQQSWQEFYEAALQELPGFVQQRLQNPPAVADHDEAMFNIRVTLLTWPIEGLNDYVDALDGWIAQWNEMIADPEQKIGRPRQLFIGATERDVPAIDKR
ncbi:MAG: hypothetical protein C4333_12950 [Meiothermus sp.]